jgi:Mg2+/Co2+ transporter CorB
MFKALIDSGHTRVPVWRDTQDNIIGVLRVAEVAREYALRGGSLADLDILSMMQEPWFVPDTTTLEEQLRAFRAHRSHFALVVDEYGALQGIVTREDILDEILGDIPDENEAESRGNIRKQKDGSYVVDGATPIRDLNRELDWNLPDDEATTIAGLVIYEARTIPEAKQRFSFYGYMFEILRRHRNQITAIRVTPPAANVERILPSP